MLVGSRWGDSLPMAEHSKDFLNRIISRHLLVRVRPGIQYIVNTHTAGINVTLINNTVRDWTGDVYPVRGGLKFRHGFDLWTDRPLPAKAFRNGLAHVDCPAFGFRALRLRG